MNIKSLVVVSVAGLLAGCVPAYGPGPARVYAGVYGEPVAFDGYYDGYYGPFYNGYWARDGYFYYSYRDGRRWFRDDGRHFRRDHWNGFHPVRGHHP